MIQANEIRLGNLIYWNIHEKEGVVHTVVGVRPERLQTIPISLGDSMDAYLPIPLTEEWLLRFGFDHCPDQLNPFKKRYPDGVRCISFRPISKKFNGDDLSETFYRWDGICDFQYVHQLQNLYFALTGEELTIK